MAKWKWAVLALLAALGIAVVAWAAAAEPAGPAAGPLAPLKIGQIVGLKDAGSAYELTTYARPVPGPYRVVEVAHDYVVVQDMAGLQDVRIPVYALKAIIHVNR